MKDKTLLIATHNRGKVEEFQALLEPLAVRVVGAGDLDLPEPEETARDFAGNARLKAEAALRATGRTALGDDSGLEVEALGGKPGLHSARWAEYQDGQGKKVRDFSYAIARVEQALAGAGVEAEGARARFVCALCLVRADGTAQSFTGTVAGHLTFPPRGNNGFGYDPIFVADGQSLTFGEMERTEKEAMSHRARAFADFSTWIGTQTEIL